MDPCSSYKEEFVGSSIWSHYESIVRNKYVLGYIVVISLVLSFVLNFFPKMAYQASHSQCTLSLLSYSRTIHSSRPGVVLSPLLG
jgi:hypothetical protein